MKHWIEEDKYFISDDSGNILLKIELVPDDEIFKHQIILTTNKEVFSGPVEFLELKN